MKKQAIFLTAALLCAGLVPAIAKEKPSSSKVEKPTTAASYQYNQIYWETDYSRAVARAKAARCLIIMDFYTDWCHYCKKLDAEVYGHPQIIKALAPRYVFLKLNPEKNAIAKQLAERFQVKTYPTTVIANSAMEATGIIDGYMPPDQFMYQITKFSSHQ